MTVPANTLRTFLVQNRGFLLFLDNLICPSGKLSLSLCNLLAKFYSLVFFAGILIYGEMSS